MPRVRGWSLFVQLLPMFDQAPLYQKWNFTDPLSNADVGRTATILPVRIMGPAGRSAALPAGIEWAANNGARIINISASTAPTRRLESAIGAATARLLTQRGARVTYSDPYVPSLRIEGDDLQSQDLAAAVKAADCVVIVTDHKSVDYASLVRDAKLIVDTRNALRAYKSENIVRL